MKAINVLVRIDSIKDLLLVNMLRQGLARGLQAVGHGFGAGPVAVLAYSRAVVLLGPGRAACFGVMVPGAASLLATPALREAPTALQVSGLLAVVVRLLLAFGVARMALMRADLPPASTGQTWARLRQPPLQPALVYQAHCVDLMSQAAPYLDKIPWRSSGPGELPIRLPRATGALPKSMPAV